MLNPFSQLRLAIQKDGRLQFLASIIIPVLVALILEWPTIGSPSSQDVWLGGLMGVFAFSLIPWIVFRSYIAGASALLAFNLVSISKAALFTPVPLEGQALVLIVVGIAVFGALLTITFFGMKYSVSKPLTQ
jgi:hypothetical protein